MGIIMLYPGCPHIFTGLEYSGASARGHTYFPVVQSIGLQYSLLSLGVFPLHSCEPWSLVVGPVGNRPSTDKLHHFVQKRRRRKNCGMWLMTFDTWNVTLDMWHMTCDTRHMASDMLHVTCDMLWGVYILLIFQLPRSYGLWFMIFWRFGGNGSPTEWINYKGVCRIAPATPGLLITRGLEISKKREKCYFWDASVISMDQILHE